jgi:hypothetical protein
MLAVEQLSRSSSEVSKEWSSAIDATVRLRPQFVQRTHDNITMMNTVMLHMKRIVKCFFGLLTHFSDSQRSTNTIVAQCQNRNAPQVHSLQGVENG